MKKIINGLRYDTETAEHLGSDWYSSPGDLNYWGEDLYRKKTGEFFLYGEGGAMSRYSKPSGTNSWSGSERIMPMTYQEAQAWAEKHLDGGDYEKIFGEVEEDGTIEQIGIQVTKSLAEKLRRRAAQEGKSFSEVASDALTAWLNKKEEADG